MSRLEGKVIIVTGAGAGIGEASTTRFLAEGARVMAVDRDQTALQALGERLASPVELRTLAVDVSTTEGTTRMVQEALTAFGRLDGLFNNAGIVPQGTVEETSEEEWDRQISINLKSVFLGCKAAIPVFRQQGGGSIVNTSSVAGLAAVPKRAAYSAAKAGIIGLSKAMALDHVGEKIRVNCVCPGTVDTPSWRARVAASPNPEEALRSFMNRQPMGRVATAEEIAAGVLYLLSDEAAFVTGTCLVIDGGWTA